MAFTILLHLFDEHFDHSPDLRLHLLDALLVLLALKFLSLARALRTDLVSQLLLCCLAERLIGVQLRLELVDFLLGFEAVTIRVCKLPPSLGSGQLVSLLVFTTYLIFLVCQ